MKPALVLSFGYSDGSIQLLVGRDAGSRIVTRDIYALPDTDLADFSALLISMHSDQRFLANRSRQIAEFLEAGGTVVANGHLAYPFLPEMTGFHAMEGYRLDDIAVKRVAEHPIWEGVVETELTFRRGVAGFYGRVWHAAPAGATVIHVLGQADRPVDFIYPVGNGRVLFHGGNDLWQFAGHDTTGRIVPQFLQWLFAGENAS